MGKSTDTLPAADHTCTSQIRGAVGGVGGKEVVKLGHKLLKFTECEEGTILGPSRARSNGVSRLIQKEVAGRKYCLTWQWCSYSADCGLTNTIKKAEV
jgi:hypothetical protein